MLRRYVRLVTPLLTLPLVLAATAAGATVLWDQSNWSTTNEGSLNLASSSCSQISGNTKVHTACDVHFDSPVTITTIRIYEERGNVEAATTAYLWITPKTGSLPTESSSLIETAANIVPITISYETKGAVTGVIVSASGLSRSLPAGDYWVSLTPRHSLGTFPYTVHYITTGPIVGDPTCAIVACTVNSNWTNPLAPNTYDYAIKIEGDQPVPAESQTWGGIRAMYR